MNGPCRFEPAELAELAELFHLTVWPQRPAAPDFWAPLGGLGAGEDLGADAARVVGDASGSGTALAHPDASSVGAPLAPAADASSAGASPAPADASSVGAPLAPTDASSVGAPLAPAADASSVGAPLAPAADASSAGASPAPADASSVGAPLAPAADASSVGAPLAPVDASSAGASPASADSPGLGAARGAGGSSSAGAPLASTDVSAGEIAGPSLAGEAATAPPIAGIGGAAPTSRTTPPPASAPARAAPPIFPAPAWLRTAELLDSRGCAAYLDELADRRNAPSRTIAASLFAKRYAFIGVVPVLYAMSVYDKGLELPPAATVFERPSPAHRAWLPGLHAVGWRVAGPAAGERDAWRERVIATLFAAHVSPLWRALSAAAKVPTAILWENAAVRIFSLYEKRLAGPAYAPLRAQIEDDYAYLVERAPARLFGERTNPLARFYGSAPSRSAAAQSAGRIRKTCCLHYRMETEEGYCANCPKTAHGGVPV